MSTPLTDLKAFDAWYEKAGVRSTVRRTLGDDEEIHTKDFFPERLIPHLWHPDVQAQEAPLRRYLAAQHLYQWLEFTSHFEVAVVCRATQLIAQNQCGLELPRNVRMDAFKICADESYHSLYSLDVVDQVVQRSGIDSLGFDFRQFLSNLDAVGDLHHDRAALVQLLQVVVFETLITSILADIPADQQVLTLVRDTVRDHAIDEGRHHAFFSLFFKHLWGQLDSQDRYFTAHALPEIILRSLQPTTRPATDALRKAGFAEPRVREIIADCYDRDSVLDGIRFASAKTVRLFEQFGVLDVPGGREAFLKAGLLPETSGQEIS
ncbi:diiron oxygenase [Streptomyces sp. NPDC055897]